MLPECQYKITEKLRCKLCLCMYVKYIVYCQKNWLDFPGKFQFFDITGNLLALLAAFIIPGKCKATTFRIKKRSALYKVFNL